MGSDVISVLWCWTLPAFGDTLLLCARLVLVEVDMSSRGVRWQERGGSFGSLSMVTARFSF
jgi:hypothetical protein